MVNLPQTDSVVEDATKQLGNYVRKDIRESFGNSKYDNALEKIGVMREELIQLQMPSLYNDFLKALKKSLLSGELNGDRREMWLRIQQTNNGKLGLITEEEDEASKVKDKEAEAVSHAHSRRTLNWVVLTELFLVLGMSCLLEQLIVRRISVMFWTLLARWWLCGTGEVPLWCLLHSSPINVREKVPLIYLEVVVSLRWRA